MLTVSSQAGICCLPQQQVESTAEASYCWGTLAGALFQSVLADRVEPSNGPRTCHMRVDVSSGRPPQTASAVTSDELDLHERGSTAYCCLVTFASRLFYGEKKGSIFKCCLRYHRDLSTIYAVHLSRHRFRPWHETTRKHDRQWSLQVWDLDAAQIAVSSSVRSIGTDVTEQH